MERRIRPTAMILVAATTLVGLVLLAPVPSLLAQAEQAGHDHPSYSDTGPGPTGELVQRTPAQSARLYQKLKGKYMSPYCPGITLGSCGSGHAELLRQDLKYWIDEGHTEADITAYLVEIFGDEIMGSPPFRGGAILVWVFPIAIVLIGGWLVARYLMRQTVKAAPAGNVVEADFDIDVEGSSASRTGDEPDLGIGLDPELDARLEDEIRAHYR